MYTIENKQNSDLQKLQEQLESQYGPAVAQEIIDRLGKTENAAKAPDYMDIKAMSELQERFRAQAMQAVWKLKQWRRTQSKSTPGHNLIQLEGVYLERNCQGAVALYRLATTRYHAMYRDAMAAFSAPAVYTPVYLSEARA
ncbi:MAG: hypothetical protein DI626_08535 [Micavibrio aeruginosavorus]|uniref:Uncharacterized protein n=1 Tax=Micavibrio aeruginosavorus TaxID=349221 RepID=A0A2W4ZV22_9BACT|nr:MAG: hypothetical protein DI626_08535 [Micavibrio aeruginosavorus]